jgi:aspartyl protease family protein
MRDLKAVMLAAVLLMSAAATEAASLFVTSIGPAHVDVLVNGIGRRLAVGQQSPEGVVLVAIAGGMATFANNGQRMVLGLGQSTMVQTSMRADAGGGYSTAALVNGVSFRAQIDSGASYVTLNAIDARRAGIDYRKGQPAQFQTANGAVRGYILTAASVQVGAVSLRNIQVAVQEGDESQLSTVLIGQSFLRHVDMRQSGGTLTISRPNY